MKLIESIASYTGESYRGIEAALTDDVKAIILKLIIEPESASNIDQSLLDELIEMDVFKYSGSRVIPNTAIFLEEDIIKLYDPVSSMATEIVDIVKTEGEALKGSSPNIRNFIGGIIGMGQGLHAALKEMNFASNWQNKSGKYERSKVDFNQECEAYKRFGEDLQIKRIHKGSKYTSVVIGPGTNDYCSYLWNAVKDTTSYEIHSYYNNLATYLTDTFPLLILGKIQDEYLKQVAQTAHIEVEDKSSVITKEDAEKYQNIILNISKACTEYYLCNIGQIQHILKYTIVGQQGAPIENMMMNFWRYMRKSIAVKLYENRFLNDKVPINGTITLFYENDIEFF